jgi:hypothetical protein
MSAVIITFGWLVAIELHAANAAHQGTGSGLFLAAGPRCVLASCEVAPIAPLLVICLGSLRRKLTPRDFELSTPSEEIWRRTAPVLAGLRSWIEAARSSPLINVDRNASALGNRADMHVTVIDVPAVWTFRIATAGEGEHPP